MSGENIQDEILNKGSELKGIFDDYQNKFDQEQLQMEKASEDLDSKLNDMLSRVNQINNYNINFSPSHSTASSEQGSEEDKNENDASKSNQNDEFSQFMDSEKNNKIESYENCVSNNYNNKIESTENDSNKINKNIRSEFKFKNMFDNQSQKDQNQSIKRKLNEVEKDKHQAINDNKKTEQKENNINLTNKNSNLTKEITNNKPVKPDFSRIFSKPLYKPEDIQKHIPDKTKEMNDVEAQKEGMIPLTPELYQRIQQNNNQLPQDVVEQNMANMNLNKDVLVCNQCRKPGHQVDQVRQPHLKALKPVERVPEGKVPLEKCGRCRAVYYCGAYCQQADWVTHKADCQECCYNCYRRLPTMLKCSRCRKAIYCNVECQARHWKEHKLLCNENK